MKDIDIKSLIDQGYTENSDLSVSYEHRFSRITLSGFILMFAPAIGYYLNYETLKNYYWYISFPFGFFLLLASIALVHTGAPLSPNTGKKMTHYRYTVYRQNKYESYTETFDVWVCHESKTFCKRLFFRSGDV